MGTRRRAFGSVRQVGRTSWEASYKVEGQAGAAELRMQRTDSGDDDLAGASQRSALSERIALICACLHWEAKVAPPRE